MKYTLPYMRDETAGNGLRTIFVPDNEQPVVIAGIQIRSGKFNTPAGLEGTADICFNLVQKGPSSIPGDDFIQEIESRGAVLLTETGDEHTIIYIRCMKMFFADVFPLFWEMVEKPAFDSKEFERIKKEMLAGIQAEKSDPDTIVMQHFMAQTCGKEHPAGRVKNSVTLKSISLEDVKSFYDNNVSPSGSTLIVAGDISEGEFQQVCLKRAEQWEKPVSQASMPAHTLRKTDKNDIRVINKPSLSQTTIIIGNQSINEFHKDKKKLLLANYILGGGNFSSRLLKSIRSETGNSYSISSQIVTFKRSGLFLIKTSTQNHQLAGVLKSIFDVYNETVQNGITEEELEKAKNFSKGNLAFELEGINNIVEKILWLGFYERDKSYIENYASDLMKITLEDVNTALKRNFSLDSFVITAVGKESSILPYFKEYGEVNCRNFRSGC